MRVLITWGSKRGGTEGIARMLGDAFRAQGIDVDLVPAAQSSRVSWEKIDAVIVGGALYANRWHGAARRFVGRHRAKLRQRPVWFFSSGPLDDSAAEGAIPPAPRVEALMERVGAQGHVTFGGRLTPDARGFPASAMAKEHAGDWRRPETIRAWAEEIAAALPTARPRPAIEQRGHSVVRLGLHALVGWAICAATMAALLAWTNVRAAIVIHGFVAPVVFALVAWRYFGAPGARAPGPVALAFVGITAVMDVAVVGGIFEGSLAFAQSLPGFWLPLALIGLVTWGVGEVRSMMPAPSRTHA